MSESEDAIRKAEGFMSEAGVDNPISVSVPLDRAKEIYHHISIELSLDWALMTVINEHGGLRGGRQVESIYEKGIPATHQDSMLVLLNQRFQVALRLNEEGEQVSDIEGESVSVPLSVREMDFLNKQLKPEKKRSEEEEKKWEEEWKQKTRENLGISDDKPAEVPEWRKNGPSDEEVEAWYRNISLDYDKERMASLIALNLAFIRAGGEPRPEFVEFYEGNLPQQ